MLRPLAVATLCALPPVVLADAARALPVARCVNLGNALDAPNEGAWGPPIARDDIAWIAAQGFDTIRLPVRFDAGWDGRIAPALLRRTDEVIGWALDDGLRVILDLHHFDALMTAPDRHGATFHAIWAELAAHYTGAPDALMFELLNEPHGALDTARLAALYAPAITAIRAHHPRRWIIAGGADWNDIAAMLALDLPQDDRIALTFHYYRPYDFTHQLADWTGFDHPARDWGSDADYATLAADFGFAATATRPVLLGEFGVYAEARLDQRARWTDAVRRAAEAQGMGWCVWALDAHFSIRDRATGDWIAPMHDALMAP
jgi:endoglucanase